MSEEKADYSATGRAFEPSKYLVNLNGKGEYLEVKWRLLWLRTEHPDAIIETEMIRLEERDAIFRARVSIPGGGAATGWGSETAGDFRDFIEKAETKAIGRALAALGYGTQFCQDHEFGVGQSAPQVNVGQMRVVDTPVDLASRNRGRQPQQPQGQQQGGGGSQERATERQVKFTIAIAREAGLDEQELSSWCADLYSQPDVNLLNRRDCSSLIEALQRRRNEMA